MPIQTEMVSFSGNGEAVDGFLARPEGSGQFPGVIVIQEWWGLNDQIKGVAQRFADEGFAALVPDLFHGKVTSEPNEAQKLMMGLDMPRAVKELTNAADYLASQAFTAGRGIGAIGFCMGGGLALNLACESPRVKAVANFYGVNPEPIDRVANINGPVLAVYGEKDAWASPSVGKELEQALARHGKEHEIKVYPGADHAFFNEARPEVYDPDAASDAWERTLRMFRANL